MDSQIQHSNPIRYVEECQTHVNYYYDNNEVCVLYISDLHINLWTKKKKISEYISMLAEDIPSTNNVIVVIAGDVTEDYEDIVDFFQEYRKKIFVKTIYVLGNHEIVSSCFGCCNTFDKWLELLKKDLLTLHIDLLENQLFVDGTIYGEMQIREMSSEELCKAVERSRLIILGGSGMSDTDKKNIFKIKPLQVESYGKKKVKEDNFRILYEKIKKAIPDRKIIVVSHYPFRQWAQSDNLYNSKWIHISGHTHNAIPAPEFENYYDDNQIGYPTNHKGKSKISCYMRLKPIMTNILYNPFEDYDDGIHQINRQLYLRFFYGMRLHRVSLNRTDLELFVLKQNGVYCFIARNKKKQLLLLNGGQLKRLEKTDLRYYYDNLFKYANNIKNFIGTFNNYLKQVADNVRDMGGFGYVHGCIVDIDSFNHLYVNPLDNSITPYYAPMNIIDKYVYRNVLSLICDQKPKLLSSYLNKMNNLSKTNNFLVKKDDVIDKKSVLVKETWMYAYSLIIKKLQYTTNCNVVRIWNDDLLQGHSNTPKKILSSVFELPEASGESIIKNFSNQFDKEKFEMKHGYRTSGMERQTIEKRTAISSEQLSKLSKEDYEKILQILNKK